MADKKVLQLTFLNRDGKEVKITINNPVEDLTGVEISPAMDAIIAANAVGETSLLAAKSGAQYVVTSSEKIVLS